MNYQELIETIREQGRYEQQSVAVYEKQDENIRVIFTNWYPTTMWNIGKEFWDEKTVDNTRILENDYVKIERRPPGMGKSSGLIIFKDALNGIDLKIIERSLDIILKTEPKT